MKVCKHMSSHITAGDVVRRENIIIIVVSKMKYIVF